MLYNLGVRMKRPIIVTLPILAVVIIGIMVHSERGGIEPERLLSESAQKSRPIAEPKQEDPTPTPIPVDEILFSQLPRRESTGGVDLQSLPPKASVEGFIQNPDGTPVADGLVGFHCTPRQEGSAFAGGFVRTNAAGYFEINDLAPGASVQVSVHQKEYGTALRETTTAPARVVFVLQEMAVLKAPPLIRLLTGGDAVEVTGIVVEMGSRNSIIPGASVRCGGAEALTDRTGSFLLVVPLDTFVHMGCDIRQAQLKISAPGFDSFVSGVNLPSERNSLAPGTYPR